MENQLQLYRGRISFINYEKQFATIDYDHNGKSKSVNFKLTSADRKPHHFRIADELSFQLKLSDRGDKLAAFNIKYISNPSVSILVQKAEIENRFSGYLKKVEEQYFVKELDSYILFPLRLSPWEIPPAVSAENAVVSFKLNNLDAPNRVGAELFSHNYIPSYYKALTHFEEEKQVATTVTKISPYGIYLALFEGSMFAKLTPAAVSDSSIKEGDTILVKIVHLDPYKLVVRAI